MQAPVGVLQCEKTTCFFKNKTKKKKLFPFHTTSAATRLQENSEVLDGSRVFLSPQGVWSRQQTAKSRLGELYGSRPRDITELVTGVFAL